MLLHFLGASHLYVCGSIEDGGMHVQPLYSILAYAANRNLVLRHENRDHPKRSKTATYGNQHQNMGVLWLSCLPSKKSMLLNILQTWRTMYTTSNKTNEWWTWYRNGDQKEGRDEKENNSVKRCGTGGNKDQNKQRNWLVQVQEVQCASIHT